MRSLLGTPWFVAGAGILIAAAVVLESPVNAVLSYGPANPGVPCQIPGCATIATKHVPDSVAALKPGAQLNAAGSRHAAAAARAVPHRAAQPASAAVTVRFRILQHGQDGFIGVITVDGSKKLGDWTLGFTIPGASISGVWGARWQSDGSDTGGVADGQPSPWPQSQSAANMARIVIFGTGTPGRPTACTFDSQTCVFS